HHSCHCLLCWAQPSSPFLSPSLSFFVVDPHDPHHSCQLVQARPAFAMDFSTPDYMPNPFGSASFSSSLSSSSNFDACPEAFAFYSNGFAEMGGKWEAMSPPEGNPFTNTVIRSVHYH